MAIGLRYSTVQSQDNKTRKTDIKGQSEPELTTDGLKFILGVGYDAGDNTAIPYLVSTKNIPMNSDLVNKQDKLTAGTKITINNNVISATYTASDFDIKELSDSTNLRTTWNNKQNALSVSQPLSLTNNNLSIDLSGYIEADGDKTIWSSDELDNSYELNVSRIGATQNVEPAIEASYCQKVMQGNEVKFYAPVSDSTGKTYAKEYYATSDKSLKENVTEVTPDNNIFNVPIVEFNWKDTKAKSIGVIAQDLEKVAPVAVSTSDSGIKSVNYTTFLLLRIAALEDKIDKLEDRLNELSK